MPIRALAIASVYLCLTTPVFAQVDTQYTRSNSNLRVSPTTSAAILQVLPRGSAVAAECDRTWCMVSTPSGERGYVARTLLQPTRPSTPRLSDADIRRILIRESISTYYGSCPCPYNADRAGRSCGRRSAYSRRGGAAPLCYDADVSSAMIRAYRARGGE